ncbi:MAG: hypothetical protein QOG58_1416, partial [Caballeronia sp.]|nr:hypothetical protein [Caballeronia sp.]
KLVTSLKIGQLMHSFVLAHQHLVFVAEVPGERREAVALGVGNSGQAEIECTGFDQLPDARARHETDGNLAPAAADQFIGEVFVDTGVGIGGIEQAVVVQRKREGTCAIGTCRDRTAEA